MGLWRYDFFYLKILFDYIAFLNFFTIKSCVLNFERAIIPRLAIISNLLKVHTCATLNI